MARPKWADRIVESWLAANPCGCGRPADYGFPVTGEHTWTQLRGGHAAEQTRVVLDQHFTATCRGCRPSRGRRPGGRDGRTVKQETLAQLAQAAAGRTCSVPVCGAAATVFVSPAGYPRQSQLAAGDQRHRLEETLAVATWFCAPHRTQVTGRQGALVSQQRRAAGPLVTDTGFDHDGSTYFFDTAVWAADRVARANQTCYGWNEAVEALLGRNRGGADIKKLKAATAYYTGLDATFPQPIWA